MQIRTQKITSYTILCRAVNGMSSSAYNTYISQGGPSKPELSDRIHICVFVGFPVDSCGVLALAGLPEAEKEV